MTYDFIFVLRSDDYHPVFNRLGSNEVAIKEILFLDDSARFVTIDADITQEGTGNLCTFTTAVESENSPDGWFNAARSYSRLRDLNYEVLLAEIKEPEAIPVAEESPVIAK
jgi:hypothetical protein